MGTDPSNSDTDGDGESDGDEVNALGSNALVANAITDTFVSEVSLGDFSSSSNVWTMTSGGLLSDSFRGEATWNFTVPRDGMWLMRLDMEIMGTTYGNEDIPIVVSVDGRLVARRNVRFGSSKFGLLQALTPWIAAGNHRISVLVDNVIARRTVRLVSIKFYEPANAAAFLARDNRIAPHQAVSRTSPAFIEGFARDVTTVTVNGVPATNGTGNGHWYANVPLSNQSSLQSVKVRFEQGWDVEDGFVWQATNVMDSESVTIRSGDSLRLGAWGTDPAMKATITLSTGAAVVLTGSEPPPSPSKMRELSKSKPSLEMVLLEP